MDIPLPSHLATLITTYRLAGTDVTTIPITPTPYVIFATPLQTAEACWQTFRHAAPTTGYWPVLFGALADLPDVFDRIDDPATFGSFVTTDLTAVAQMATAAVAQAMAAQPNTTMVQITSDGLKAAAQNIAAALPSVLPLATQIADALRKLVGG